MYLLFAILTAQAQPERHALVVGANIGQGPNEDLLYAERDADRVSELLVELGDFAPDHLQLLRQPTRAELTASFDALADQVDPDDFFLFYYSGHADGSGLQLGDERISYADLR
ncbi:MAG: caspase family protein, partial [Myxococcota bacterium]|nr:caspase family protein [Myxococcota bacterium]